MAKRFPISKKAFSAWVHAAPKNRRWRNHAQCPLARALEELTPKEKQHSDYWGQNVSVGSWMAEVGNDNYELPLWAQNFVSRFDGGEHPTKII